MKVARNGATAGASRAPPEPSWLSRLGGAKRLFALAHRHFVSENSRAIFDRLWSTDTFLPMAKTRFQYPLGPCSSWHQRVACAHSQHITFVEGSIVLACASFHFSHAASSARGSWLPCRVTHRCGLCKGSANTISACSVNTLSRAFLTVASLTDSNKANTMARCRSSSQQLSLQREV